MELRTGGHLSGPHPLEEGCGRTGLNIEWLCTLWGKALQCVAVNGKRAFVGVDECVVVLDITNPTSPRPVSFIELGAAPRGIALAGSLLIVAADDAGLKIIDAKDETRPRVTASCELPGQAVGVAAHGAMAAVTVSDAGLSIVDISDPNKPLLLNSFDTNGIAHNVILSGAEAYLADGESGIQIFDLSDPHKIKLVGTCDTPGDALDLTLVQNMLCVADEAEDTGLQIIDISHSGKPTIVGNFVSGGFPSGIFAQKSLVFVATYFDLVIVEIGDRGTPILRGKYELPCEAAGRIVAASNDVVSVIETHDIQFFRYSPNLGDRQ
ncbi:hypothetical protein HY256_04035 [Candidatus Sumerlaeota bacterium]|nr:hypothetical protein [Candidatus Sumerlaeota bacterium]